MLGLGQIYSLVIVSDARHGVAHTRCYMSALQSTSLELCLWHFDSEQTKHTYRLDWYAFGRTRADAPHMVSQTLAKASARTQLAAGARV